MSQRQTVCEVCCRSIEVTLLQLDMTQIVKHGGDIALVATCAAQCQAFLVECCRSPIIALKPYHFSETFERLSDIPGVAQFAAQRHTLFSEQPRSSGIAIVLGNARQVDECPRHLTSVVQFLAQRHTFLQERRCLPEVALGAGAKDSRPAKRVLPQPPAPVSVTSRDVASRRATSALSCTRPMKLLN